MRYPDWVYDRLSATAESGFAPDGVNTLVSQIVALAEKARREGILALEDGIDEIGNSLLRFGIILVVDGNDPGIIGDILCNTLFFQAREGDLLQNVVIIEGILGIQEGINPRTLSGRLMSFLGADAGMKAYTQT